MGFHLKPTSYQPLARSQHKPHTIREIILLSQPAPHGHLSQDLVQDTTTSQPQSPHTQTTPSRQKLSCKPQASTWENAHSQLHTIITEHSQGQQTSNTSQPQSPPTQTTPSRKKVPSKSQASTRESAHDQLQLSTVKQLHATITEPSQGQKTSSQHQLKSLHACGNSHAHETLSAAHDLCSPCVSPTSTSYTPLAFPTSQTQVQSIS